jgi:hypothetical protein
LLRNPPTHFVGKALEFHQQKKVEGEKKMNWQRIKMNDERKKGKKDGNTMIDSTRNSSIKVMTHFSFRNLSNLAHIKINFFLCNMLVEEKKWKRKSFIII